MEQQEQQQADILKQQALRMPHQLFLVDEILKVHADSEQVQVTLGWKTPADTINPIATLQMTASFADKLAKAIQTKK
jgi:hypothetical protein